jgi:hypothetical protein
MSIHKPVSLSETEWIKFNNLIKEHVKKLEPIIKHDDYHIYDPLSCDTSVTKKLKLASIQDNSYYKDEGNKIQRIIVLPIKINNSKFTIINLELKNENSKHSNILNEGMIFGDISNNQDFLNYDISEHIVVKDANKLSYIIFTINKVSRNLSFSNYYNLYVKSNKKVLHKFKRIYVMSKRKKRKTDSEEIKVMSKKKKHKTESYLTDTANDKSDNSFTIESFADFIKMTANSLKRIESKVDKIQEDLNQLKKDKSNVNNVNNISIKCFNDEYPKYDAILPSFALDEAVY